MGMTVAQLWAEICVSVCVGAGAVPCVHVHKVESPRLTPQPSRRSHWGLLLAAGVAQPASPGSTGIPCSPPGREEG